jgi:hypothetical protein
MVVLDGTAMLLAAEKQDWRMLERVLCDVNLPQHAASSLFDYFDTSQKFVGSCVDPDTGMNPLHWIARYGRLTEAHFIEPVHI